MVRVGIIADDYTGAADAGVQFAKKGLRTSILTDPQRISEVAKRVDVIVVDTESRLDSKEIAYKKVALVSQELNQIGVDFLYKKVDSTLRGNIGVEIDSVVDALNVSMVILCPAYPKNGRITVGGFHLLNQDLIENTEMAKDPKSPVEESHIPTLVRAQSKYKVSHIDISTVSKGFKALQKEITKHQNRGSRITVVDAMSQGDLKVIAKTVSTLNQPLLVCGSAGLAEELPEALNLTRSEGKMVVVIAGSVSAVTAQQILKAEKSLNMKVVEVGMRQVFMGERERSLEVSRVVEKVQEAFDEREDVAIRWAESQSSAEEIKRFGRKLGLEDDAMRKGIGGVLGEISLAIINGGRVGGMVLSGGETAFNVYEALNILETQVEEEVLPGIPILKFIGGKADGIRVVTKAGAFGDEDTLVKIIECLRKRR